MAELKTKPTTKSVETFLNTIKDEQKRKDCYKILKIMKSATKSEPKMWGESIVGFGSYHYKYASGREGDWMLTGFSPRKQNISIYIMTGFEAYRELLKNLGKHKTSVGCLFINKLEDLDTSVLKKLITDSVKKLSSKN